MVIKKINGYDIGIDYDHYMDEKQELYYRFTLADKIHKNLNHSLQIVYHIINNRYPNLLIDKILDKFGTYTLLS